uniref:Uncharacterized protein n=1 Tax=Tanacetum cinerariifolium TaxID=118510 RepID=A0A699H2W3_TANCI|nr:hypothetical protein [Tanacetum cinerariifolium]
MKLVESGKSKIITAVVATTLVADTSSVPVPSAGNEPVFCTPFVDSASTSEAGQDVAGPSNLARTELSGDTFYVSQEMDSETLQQIYEAKVAKAIRLRGQVATVEAVEAAQVNELDDLKDETLPLLVRKDGGHGNLGIPVSLSLRLYAWLASNTLSIWLWLPRTLVWRACRKILCGFLL